LTALRIAYRIRIGEAYEDGLRDGANIAEPVKADRDALANELKTVREVLATVRNRLARCLVPAFGGAGLA